MFLNEEQKAILNGEKGETLAKVMKALVMYGEAFNAEKLVPITSRYNHLVTSFGLKVMSPVYDLMQQLLDAGVASGQKFSVDPRPIDKNVPANFLQNFVFNKFMYSKQDFYEEQLKKLGLHTAHHLKEIKLKIVSQTSPRIINQSVANPVVCVRINWPVGENNIRLFCSQKLFHLCITLLVHLSTAVYLGKEYRTYTHHLTCLCCLSHSYFCRVII